MACFPTDQPTEPPLDSLYIPTGVALSQSGNRLYIANSNFDVAYDRGTVMALDVEELEQWLPQRCRSDADCGGATCDTEGDDERAPTYWCLDGGSPCGPLGEQRLTDRARSPGLCSPLNLADSDALVGSVLTAPFAMDLVMSQFEEGGETHSRLLLPVRGDATVHWIDVDPGGRELDCGQGSGDDCDAEHKSGDSADELEPEFEIAKASPDLTQLPTDPFALSLSPDGRSIVTTHSSLRVLSLLSNSVAGVSLQYVLTGLPAIARSIVTLPAPRWLDSLDSPPLPGFLATFSGATAAPAVRLYRLHDGPDTGEAGPFLDGTGASRLTTANNTGDARGIAINEGSLRRCEAACDSEPCSGAGSACDACLAECAKLPLEVFVASRSPDALLIGETVTVNESLPDGEVVQLQSGLPDFTDMVPVAGGPSRVVVGDVIGLDGLPEPRVFVLAFNGRLLYIVNPETRTLETRVITGRGPTAMTVDSERGLGYVAHFCDSNVGVFDLDRRSSSYGELLMQIGRRVPLENCQ